MDKENMAYITMKSYSATKKNEMMTFAGKCMKLEIIMLSKISQTQKDKYHVFSHTQNLNHGKRKMGHEHKKGTTVQRPGEDGLGKRGKRQ
jgi:hypothetical protein